MRTIILSLTACLLAIGLLAAQPAGAIVPPRDCGFTTVKGKRYNIKADQMRCSPAKRNARRYLRSRRPSRCYSDSGCRWSGYRCKNYRPKQTAQAFNCKRGVKRFFAIRR